jgi:hypothetical protein
MAAPLRGALKAHMIRDFTVAMVSEQCSLPEKRQQTPV